MGTVLAPLTVPTTIGSASAGVSASVLTGMDRTINIAGLAPGDTLDIEGANADIPGYYAEVLRISYGGSPAATVTLAAENSQWYRVRRIALHANDHGTGRTVLIAGSPGSGGPSGTAIIDFGLAPAVSQRTSTSVSGQSSIPAGASVKAYLVAEATATHSAYEHEMPPIQLVCGNVSQGVGFTIVATSEWQLNGTFNVRWEWV